MDDDPEDPKWGEIYKRYLLICTPYNAPNGKFAPRLIIEKMGPQPDSTGPIPIVGGKKYYDSEQEAAEVARLVGRQWVDHRR